MVKKSPVAPGSTSSAGLDLVNTLVATQSSDITFAQSPISQLASKGTRQSGVALGPAVTPVQPASTSGDQMNNTFAGKLPLHDHVDLRGETPNTGFMTPRSMATSTPVDRRRSGTPAPEKPLSADRDGPAMQQRLSEMRAVTEHPTENQNRAVSQAPERAPSPAPSPDITASSQSAVTPRRSLRQSLPQHGAPEWRSQPSSTQTPAAGAVNARTQSAQASTAEQRRPAAFVPPTASTSPSDLIAHLFPHCTLPSLTKSPDVPNIAADERTFDRRKKHGGIGSVEQGAISFGGDQTDAFRSHHHFLAIRSEQNIYPPHLSALGEPIVVITSREKCVKYRRALAVRRRMDDGSVRAAINVFVRRAPNEWVYRGAYELAFDGSDEHALRLTPGPDASTHVPEEIRTAVESRIDRPEERKAKQAMIRGWGWRFPGRTDWSRRAQVRDTVAMKANLWTELEQADVEMRIPFLVLRCIGFSEADYTIWRK
ncbi:hypothetical protein JCM3774_004383 [Rhodotorula dairenensis]